MHIKIILPNIIKLTSLNLVLNIILFNESFIKFVCISNVSYSLKIKKIGLFWVTDFFSDLAERPIFFVKMSAWSCCFLRSQQISIRLLCLKIGFVPHPLLLMQAQGTTEYSNLRACLH